MIQQRLFISCGKPPAPVNNGHITRLLTPRSSALPANAIYYSQLNYVIWKAVE